MPVMEESYETLDDAIRGLKVWSEHGWELQYLAATGVGDTALYISRWTMEAVE